MVKKGNVVVNLSVNPNHVIKLKQIARDAGMTLSGFMVRASLEVGTSFIKDPFRREGVEKGGKE